MQRQESNIKNTEIYWKSSISVRRKKRGFAQKQLVKCQSGSVLYKYLSLINIFFGKSANTIPMSETTGPRVYKKISRDQRFELLSLILQKKYTIKGAAQNLGIGASTARMILKKFEATKEVFESKSDRRTRLIIEKIEKEKAEVESSPKIETSNQPKQVPMVYMPVFYYWCPDQAFYQPPPF